MRAKVKEKAQVPAVVAILAIFIVLYSLWGASLLHAQQDALSQSGAHAVATNL